MTCKMTWTSGDDWHQRHGLWPKLMTQIAQGADESSPWLPVHGSWIDHVQDADALDTRGPSRVAFAAALMTLQWMQA